MKAPNTTLRGKAMTAVTGLAAIVSGCVKLDTSALPALDQFTGTRPSAVYEGDLQLPLEKRPVQDGFAAGVYSFAVSPGYDDQPTAEVITPLESGDDRQPPADFEVRYFKDAEQRITGGQLILHDNDRPFVDGARFYVKMHGATYFGAGFSSPVETLEFTYFHGKSNGTLTEEQPTPVVPQPTPIETLLAKTYAQVEDPQGNAITGDLIRKDFSVRLYMPKELETRLTQMHGSAVKDFYWQDRGPNAGIDVNFAQPVLFRYNDPLTLQVAAEREGTRTLNGVETAVYVVDGLLSRSPGASIYDVAQIQFDVNLGAQSLIPFADPKAIEVQKGLNTAGANTYTINANPGANIIYSTQ